MHTRRKMCPWLWSRVEIYVELIFEMRLFDGGIQSVAVKCESVGLLWFLCLWGRRRDCLDGAIGPDVGLQW